MGCRGIRGAITVEANTPEAILAATRELLERIVAVNQLRVEDLVSVILTATSDLDAAYPARAARDIGWVNVPLLCIQEMDVVGSLRRCIRVLVHWNTDLPNERVRHVYLGGAQALRIDLMEEKES
jgi:chorismate mutase